MRKTHLSTWDVTLKAIRATEHAIVSSSDALPIRAQPYRTGPLKRQIMTDQINKRLKLKFIARSHSAWASLVVIVHKKNGQARFCVGYSRLNNITKKDTYPWPRMEDCHNSLETPKYSLLSTAQRDIGKCHCAQKIKRRRRSRRIVVYTTDNLCHLG